MDRNRSLGMLILRSAGAVVNNKLGKTVINTKKFSNMALILSCSPYFLAWSFKSELFVASRTRRFATKHFIAFGEQGLDGIYQ
jgi:hypothetical protein